MTGPVQPSNKWVYRTPWTRVMMFLYCLCCSFVGLLGWLENPSPSIEAQLGHAAVLLYSSILVVSGILGAIGIFRSLHATVISVWAIAAATFFHGVAAVGNGSAQVGFRLIIAPMMMVPLVWTWMQWLIMVKHVTHIKLPRRPHKET